jgi:hypothetical protein
MSHTKARRWPTSCARRADGPINGRLERIQLRGPARQLLPQVMLRLVMATAAPRVLGVDDRSGSYADCARTTRPGRHAQQLGRQNDSLDGHPGHCTPPSRGDAGPRRTAPDRAGRGRAGGRPAVLVWVLVAGCARVGLPGRPGARSGCPLSRTWASVRPPQPRSNWLPRIPVVNARH